MVEDGPLKGEQTGVDVVPTAGTPQASAFGLDVMRPVRFAVDYLFLQDLKRELGSLKLQLIQLEARLGATIETVRDATVAQEHTRDQLVNLRESSAYRDGAAANAEARLRCVEESLSALLRDVSDLKAARQAEKDERLRIRERIDSIADDLARLEGWLRGHTGSPFEPRMLTDQRSKPLQIGDASSSTEEDK